MARSRPLALRTFEPATRPARTVPQSGTPAVEQLHQATELLQQMQQSSKLQDLELKIRDLEQQGRERETRAPSKARRANSGEEAESSHDTDGEDGVDESGDGSTSLVTPHPGATDRYDVRVSRAPVGEVLGRLAKLAGRSLVVDSRARGSITARLENVSFEEALQALTRAGQLAVESDGRTLTVTAVDSTRPVATAPRVEARVLRMRHLDPDEFRRLVEPLLTPQIGRVSRGTTARSRRPRRTNLRATISTGGGPWLSRMCPRPWRASNICFANSICRRDRW